MEKYQPQIRLVLSQPSQPIECHNFKNGHCIARSTCAQILAGTKNNTDPLVQDGRKIAEDIVANGATLETTEGKCGALTQDIAERRCNGFLPVLLPPSPSTRIDM